MRTSAVNSKYIFSQGKRFEGKFYLNDNSFLSMEVERHAEKTKPLSELATVFNPPVFKRQFCQQTERSVPYFQSSDVPMAEENSQVYVFKGQAENLNLLVKKDDILVTGFGTIGNTRLVSKYQDGTCYANNVCRIRANEGVYKGFVYAFLSSKFGISQLNKNASGSVVRYIEAPGIKKTLIPQFSDAFQKDIDTLIQDSVTLREAATEALEEAHNIIEQNFEIARSKKSSCVSVKTILSSHNKRFEAFYHTSINRSVFDYIKTNFEYKNLGELTESIFRPGIFKRDYVSNGITFLGGADILLSIPKSDKKLSIRQVNNMPELKVKKDWILVTCGGTIGNTVLIDRQLEKCVISQHVMRIVPKDDILKGYLYAVLSSEIGKKLITMFTTGSVIPQIEAHHLELVPIPLLKEEIMKHIDNLVSIYVTKIEDSKEKEAKAVSMVEQEIEKWNK